MAKYMGKSSDEIWKTVMGNKQQPGKQEQTAAQTGAKTGTSGGRYSGMSADDIWKSVMEGGGQERGKRPGTENLPAIMGMAAALKEECTLMEQNEAKVIAMRDRLIQGLSQIPYSILNGSREKRLPGNVNFCFEGVSGESLLLLVLPAHQVPWIQALYFFLLVSLLKSPRAPSESALTFPILRKKSIICWK